MVILVHSFLKFSLFIGLFLLSFRLIHVYPFPMTDEQLRWWFAISEKFDIQDPENLEISLTFIANIIFGFFLYLALLKLWALLRATR
ncbi:hypothetical protein BX592_116125 [Paraburkholderia rhizosphaerae]|uniref:Uncharacterized protein n=1 Tax=Paraburkholderia rhizosphaerae TaxID=480658 RepID=A0A4R8LM84_9BURK|nr:hypothetical protein BX592_116125 [Paraburkholderia rhizosphaerae]